MKDTLSDFDVLANVNYTDMKYGERFYSCHTVLYEIKSEINYDRLFPHNVVEVWSMTKIKQVNCQFALKGVFLPNTVSGIT